MTRWFLGCWQLFILRKTMNIFYYESLEVKQKLQVAQQELREWLWYRLDRMRTNDTLTFYSINIRIACIFKSIYYMYDFKKHDLKEFNFFFQGSGNQDAISTTTVEAESNF